MKTYLLILSLFFTCFLTACEKSEDKNIEEFHNEGYLVGYDKCSGTFTQNDKEYANGYFIITSDFKDTLVSYNITPEIYNIPIETFDNGGKHKVSFSHRTPTEDEMIYSICPSNILIEYSDAKQIIIESITKIETDFSITDIKWKLIGIVDAETHDLTELEPYDCEDCYTLTFDTDSTFIGKSSTNLLFGYFTVNSETHELNIINISGTEAGEYGHGYIYVETLWKIQFFTAYDTSPKTLHLYYNDT